jgi:hypothetical protein
MASPVNQHPLSGYTHLMYALHALAAMTLGARRDGKAMYG